MKKNDSDKRTGITTGPDSKITILDMDGNPIPSSEINVEETKHKSKAVTYLLRGLLVVGTTLGVLLITIMIMLNMFCNGPSRSAKQLFVTTILETGQLKFLASIYLSPEERQALVDDNSLGELDSDVDPSLIVIGTASPTPTLPADVPPEGISATPFVTSAADSKATATPTPTEVPAETGEDIEVYEISGRTYSATMMIIKDPSRVFVATTYPWGEKGKNLDVIVNEAGALAGVNGGLYNSYDNSGSNPYGVAVSNGEIQYNSPTSYSGLYMIGFNNDNILIIKNLAGMTASDFSTYVKDNGIRDAVAFQEESSDVNNHFVSLIINGVERELNGMGSGLNPRTAIGQRADGAVLLLVTDGRGSSGHLGASASDLINIMSEYGAVNAANLDGGSSSCMYYNGEYLRSSVTFYYTNSSWRLPTAFVVK